MNILSRYLVRSYLGLFATALAAATGLSLVVDFFLRIGDFAAYDSPATLVASYFLLKVPKMAAEIYPAAALLAVLVSVGSLVERDEVLAMRSCGVSPWGLAVPLVGASLLLSVVVFVWNETVVPPTASRARTIKLIDIKQEQYRGLHDASSIWFQTDSGFVNVDYFDASRAILQGYTALEITDDFRLGRVLRIPEAHWDGFRWQSSGGGETVFDGDSDELPRVLTPEQVRIVDTPDELRAKRRRAYEFSFWQLLDQIARLRAKGVDANEYLVDLHFKVASPLAGVIAVALGIPLATRRRRRSGAAYAVGAGAVVCFVFWFAMSVSVSAGHAGRLPPPIAAWAPNVLFATVALWMSARLKS